MQPTFELTCMSLVAIDNLVFTGHEHKSQINDPFKQKEITERQFIQNR